MGETLEGVPGLEGLVLPRSEKAFLEELLRTSNLILPQYGVEYRGTPLEEVFVPSASTDESDWHILDKRGRRIIKERIANDEEGEREKREEVKGELQDGGGEEEVGERETEGGFRPSVALIGSS